MKVVAITIPHGAYGYVPRAKRPQCVAEPHEPPAPYIPPGQESWRQWRYSRRPGNPKQCQKAAVVLIDDKPYCSLHGGLVCLHHMLTEDA